MFKRQSLEKVLKDYAAKVSTKKNKKVVSKDKLNQKKRH